MKKILSVIMIIAIGLNLVGFENKSEENIVNKVTSGIEDNSRIKAVAKKPTKKPISQTKIKTKDIYKKITAGTKRPAQVPIDSQMLKDQYGIDKSILEDYVVMAPMMMVSASECAIFKVKNTKDIKKVRAGISKRLKNLDRNWSTYLPEQHDLVKNAKIVSKGKYIIFVVDKSASKMISKFNSIVK